MKKRKLIWTLFIVAIYLMDMAKAISQISNSISTGSYLGQTPPGLSPKIFAPGIICTNFNERGLVFSPDGKELFYEKWGWPWSSVIIHMQIENNKWSSPKIAKFSGVPDYSDGSPFFSYDGTKLYFSSLRPKTLDGDIPKDNDIWMVKKENGAWGEAENLGIVVNSNKSDAYPTVAKNGNLYFTSNREGSEGYDIWLSKWENNKYQKPIRLPSPINTSYFDGHPCISADESFLLLTSNRPGDLGDLDIWVSFRDTNENWTNPINLGEAVNSKYHEADPSISKDGKYIFWMSERGGKWPYEIKRYNIDEFDEILLRPGYDNNDIFWIDIEIISKLKTQKL